MPKIEDLKTGILDLETSGLNADYGMLMCACIKEVGGPLYTFRLDKQSSYKEKPWCDKSLVKQVLEKAKEYDVLVAHYGTYFDRPFLNTRLIIHNLEAAPKVYFLDTWKIARFKLRLSSNRQASLARAFFGETIKNSIKPDVWMKALTGHTPSLDYQVHHCRLDVTELERIYLHILKNGRSLLPEKLRKS